MILARVFANWPIGGILFIWGFARVWSLCIARDMLNTILRSGMGKRSKSYKKAATWFQRLYGSYVPRVTRYRHRLSIYLAINNVGSAFVSIFLALMALSIANGWMSNQIRHIFEYSVMAAILFLCMPPVVISFAQTSYSGGHPYYWFDLERDFIGVKAQNQKRALLKEKRSSVILTPDDFLRRYRNK